MKIFLSILFVLSEFLCYSQNNIEQIKSTDYSDSLKIDSLKSIYGYNKEIPKNYEIPILIALSYFPELDNANIVIKNSRIKTTLNARPTIISLLFNKKSNRKYVIRINSLKKDSVILLDSVPISAMIGLFGHEFCHFIDYNSKNIFGIIGRLVTYSNKKSKEKFEKEIDIMTIKRGLGWQLYDWSYYVLNESSGTIKYKEFKKQIYLEPEEIKMRITGSNKN